MKNKKLEDLEKELEKYKKANDILEHQVNYFSTDLQNYVHKNCELENENKILMKKLSDLSVETYHLKQEKEYLKKSNNEFIEENKKLKDYSNDYRVLEFILEECKFKLTRVDTFDIVKNTDKTLYFIEIYKVRNYHDFIALEITEKQYNLFNLLNLRRI